MAQSQPNNPSPPQKNPAKKIIIIILSVLLVLGILSAIGGYLIYRTVKNAADEAGIEDISQAVLELEQYPDAYKRAGLPEFPGAKVTSLGGRTASAEEGASIILTTEDNTAKVIEYFNTQLTSMGWVAADDATPQQDNFYFKTFSKDNQEYALTVQTTESGESSVAIFWGKAGN